MKSIISIFALIASLLAGPGGMASAAEPARKALVVVASRQYLESEYEGTRRALEEAGISVEVASDGKTATGYSSGQIKPDLLIGEADPARYDAVVVVGGVGASLLLWQHQALQTLLQRAHAGGKVVAALCAAPPVLANAGLLKGLKATMWPDRKWIDTLEAGGAHYVDEPVVVEGRIITGRNPAATRAFGERVAQTVNRAG